MFTEFGDGTYSGKCDVSASVGVASLLTILVNLFRVLSAGWTLHLTNKISQLLQEKKRINYHKLN